MFAVRDQENIVRTRQTGKGGSEPGVQKTPFAAQSARPGAVTPAHTNRLPLGLKTTNAKAKAFQTPLPGAHGRLQLQPSRLSPRLNRPKKIQVLQAESRPAGPGDGREDEREIEQMAPNSLLRASLPDLPLDQFGPTKSFSVLQGRNFAHGWAAYYDEKVGTSPSVRARADAESDDDDLDRLVRESVQVAKRPVRPALSTVAPSIQRARSNSRSRPPVYARPTVSSAAFSKPPRPRESSTPSRSLTREPVSRTTSATTTRKRDPAAVSRPPVSGLNSRSRTLARPGSAQSGVSRVQPRSRAGSVGSVDSDTSARSASSRVSVRMSVRSRAGSESKQETSNENGEDVDEVAETIALARLRNGPAGDDDDLLSGPGVDVTLLDDAGDDDHFQFDIPE